jgi:hypothetical protein
MGKLVHATSSDIFIGAGFISNPTHLEERDAPTSTVAISSAQEEMEE